MYCESGAVSGQGAAGGVAAGTAVGSGVAAGVAAGAAGAAGFAGTGAATAAGGFPAPWSNIALAPYVPAPTVPTGGLLAAAGSGLPSSAHGANPAARINHPILNQLISFHWSLTTPPVSPELAFQHHQTMLGVGAWPSVDVVMYRAKSSKNLTSSSLSNLAPVSPYTTG